MKAFKKSIVLLFFGACLNATYSAETVGIFSDNSVEQIKFAVGDIKTALEAKSFTVEILPLSSLTSGYANKKVVVALSSNSAATTVLTGQGGTAPAALGEQAYALITTTQGQTTYWAFGGDANGAMYGGLQLAENIGATGFTGTNTAVEKPFMMNRGLKLNLPLDKRIPTYVGNWTARSAKRAIPAVWDSTFWKDLIDQQARFRYNMLSVWVHHPFPALVKVAGYENACLPDIQGFDGFMRTDLTPDARVAFWRRIMQYAHNRGMSFYFFNWNVVLDYAKTQIPGLKEDLTTQATKDYLYKSMQALIATYPELDGFGTTTGDNMPNGSDAVEQANVKWSWDCYGKAVLDYLAANPSRKFNFIHRSTGTSPNNTFPTYAPLSAQPNANMDMSVKYAVAHMYSTTTPRWTSDIDAVAALGKKTWATVRNDDYVYINWGDPQFVREFINGFPHQEVIKGIYIGADGWSETKTYFYKNGFAPLNGGLEVKRRWYMQMLWGRLSYNPSTTDDVFKNMLAKRYPQTSSDNLFTAWTKASRPLPKMTELVMGNWDLDHDWWPEACWSDPGRHTGFRPIAEMAGAGKEGTTVAKGSTLCDIKTSAAGTCGPKKNSYTVANEMQADADQALSLIKTTTAAGNSDLDVAVRNIKQMAYLSQYYAYKVRGATYKAATKTDSAKVAMGKAYCSWMAYTREMDEMYEGDSVRNLEIYPDFKFGDAAVLKEYTDLGGVGAPTDCGVVGIEDKAQGFTLQKPISSIRSFSSTGMLLNLSEAGRCEISVVNSAGKQVYNSKEFDGKKGINNLQFGKQMGRGVYTVRINTGNSSIAIRQALMNN